MKPNWKNQSVFIGDNIDIMRAMNSESADQICTDPPFNKNKRFDHVFGGKREIGFDDAWTMDDARKEEFEDLRQWQPNLFQICRVAGINHSKGMQGYLVFMATRLIECHRILKETGSIYLHCDHSANAYLRMLMDGIFKEKNFRNQIIWKRQTNSGAKAKSKRKFGAMCNTILFYAKSEAHKINHLYMPVDDDYLKRVFRMKDKKGNFKVEEIQEASQAKLEEYEREGLLYKSRTGKLGKKKYDWQFPGILIGNLWTDFMALGSNSKERSGWVTQKPIKLYQRMIMASSNPGDVVLDPFCGCATTLVAAENAGRQWVGIDRHPEAEKQVVQQLTKLNEGTEDWLRKVNIERKPPKRQRKSLSAKQKEAAFSYLFTKQDGKCLGCGEAPGRKHLDIDHNRPLSRGGDNDIGNLQLLCGHCNSLKGNGTMEELLRKLGNL